MLHIFESRRLLSFSTAREGELLADTSIAISTSVTRPHIFLNKNGSPSGRCLGSTVRIPVLPRHRKGATSFRFSISEVAPGLLQFTPYSAASANPCQLLTYETHFSRPPRYCGCIAHTHQTSTFLLAVKHVPTRRLWLRASRRSLSTASGGHTLGVYASIQRLPLSAFSAWPYPHNLPCCPERCEECGTCSGSVA